MANPKLLGFLTCVIILISGFIANKNKQAYESEIVQTKVEDQKLQDSRKRLKDAQETLTATIAQREGVEAEIAKLQIAEADQKKLNQDLKADLDDKIAKVSVVGVGMRSHVGVASKMFRALSEEGINIQMISTSEIKISVIIDERYLELAVRVLHKAFGLDQETL